MLCPVLSSPLFNLFVPWSESLTWKVKHRNCIICSYCGYRIACHWKETFGIKFLVSSCGTYMERKKRRNYICSVFWSLRFEEFIFIMSLSWESCLQKLNLFLKKKIDVRFFSYHRVSSARSCGSTKEKYCTYPFRVNHVLKTWLHLYRWGNCYSKTNKTHFKKLKMQRTEI